VGEVMANPFKYGTVVSGDDFADRQKELKELAVKLKETVRIFLLAPRRYGKTSLIKGVLNRLKKKGFLVVYTGRVHQKNFSTCTRRASCAVPGPLQGVRLIL
jgi:AAA+ ATPase superfamily predicted ATPase